LLYSHKFIRNNPCAGKYSFFGLVFPLNIMNLQFLV
jgi:hypothetical protein